MLKINDLELKNIFAYDATNAGPQYDKDNLIAQENFKPYEFDHKIKSLQTYKGATFNVKHLRGDSEDRFRIGVVSTSQEGCPD